MSILRRLQPGPLPYRDYTALIDHFKDVLTTASAERRKRPDLVFRSNGDSEFEWVLYERSVMRGEVNRLRAESGFAPVDEQCILRVETQASGHIDYVAKFAYGCADLALYEDGAPARG